MHRACLDVSSEKALAHALTCGIPGRRCQASGPKASSYLGLSLQHDALISIDSVGELEQLRYAISLVPDQKARVLLRLANDSAATHALDSQFGVLKSELGQALELLAANKERIELVGFHHHLYSPTDGERARAFEDAFDAVRAARHSKLNPTVINLGGGMRIRYAESSEDWSRFEGYLKDSVIGLVNPITWNNSGLGYSTHQGKVVGGAAFIDPVPVTWGAEELERLLDIRLPRFEHQTIGSLGADALIDLYVEPGRAMFDQAGLTVAQVIGTKKSALGHPVLSLEMNHSNLRSSQQKLLTQPVFIPRGERKQSTTGFFLTGNLCTTHDVIQQQKVYPGFVPERGDVVVFCNTAAYLMDFAESEMLHQPTARKLAVFGQEGTFKAVLDEVYSPWDMIS
jgi:diaminopimelate decarboxylase